MISAFASISVVVGGIVVGGIVVGGIVVGGIVVEGIVGEFCHVGFLSRIFSDPPFLNNCCLSRTACVYLSF